MGGGVRVGPRVGVACGETTAGLSVGVRVGIKVAVATIGHGSVADTSKMALPHRTASARPRIIKHKASASWNDDKWEPRIVGLDTWNLTRVELPGVFLPGEHSEHFTGARHLQSESHLISQKPSQQWGFTERFATKNRPTPNPWSNRRHRQVPPAGIEPASQPPQGCALSGELRGHPIPAGRQGFEPWEEVLAPSTA